ncbi:hypothetical protein AVDCRST_MAG81-2300 [uncultured Synechococcales cyanobacterium]|uniref:Uncharacterized protein n=1 Tax=uncultured Synechococcales cyanobacterium TaxID=1936017 RepID=A0A6J4VGJ3_9CYAN|nr:hypothetical protein AVDCRST_MAG81-2300 [uncultured Synechococcales cyanobacterium]
MERKEHYKRLDFISHLQHQESLPVKLLLIDPHEGVEFD